MNKLAGSIARMLHRAGRLTPNMLDRLVKSRVLSEHYVRNPHAVRSLGEAYRAGDVAVGHSLDRFPERIRQTLHKKVYQALKRKPMYRPIASGLESGITEVAPGIGLKIGPRPPRREFDLPMLMKGDRPVMASLLEGQTANEVLRNPKTGEPVMAYLQEKIKAGPSGATSSIDQRISSGVTLNRFFRHARDLERQGWKIVDAPVEGGLRQFGTTSKGELKLIDPGAVVASGEYTPLVKHPSPVAQIRQLLADPTFKSDVQQAGYRDIHRLMSDRLADLQEPSSFLISPLKRRSFRTRPAAPLI